MRTPKIATCDFCFPFGSSQNDPKKSGPLGVKRKPLLYGLHSPNDQAKKDEQSFFSLNILYLLADLLQLALNIHHDGGNIGVLALGADGVGLAIHFLHQEI